MKNLIGLLLGGIVGIGLTAGGLPPASFHLKAPLMRAEQPPTTPKNILFIIADDLTYVRNSFGNQAPAILPDRVKKVRVATESKKDFYSPNQLLKEHLMEK